MRITGMILAGGRGTRMGDIEKGLQPFRGKTLVGNVIARLAPQVDRLAINANRDTGAYAAFGVPVWPDLRSDLPGPLAGVEAGLAASETEFLVTVPCDSPFLPMDLVERLRDALLAANADLAYAVTVDGQAHPVFSLLRRSVLPGLRAFLDADQRKMGVWLRAQHAAEAAFDDEAAFRNINTLDELQRYEGP